VKDKLGKLMATRGTTGKLRVRGDTFGYLQRSFPTIVSETDAAEARQCGRLAVQYALGATNGLNSGSVAMKRVSNSPYKIDFFPTPLNTVARQTKPLPAEWVSNGNDVAAAYIEYAKPLVGPLPKPGKLF
jgi:6-phosphofructokinase 1